MAQEFGDVALGGLTIGFARVEVDAAGIAVDLAAPGLLAFPSSAAPEVTVASSCPCRSEDLTLAKVRSRHGAGWSLGVRVCAAHRCLRAA
jgi:hypothetical protein